MQLRNLLYNHIWHTYSLIKPSLMISVVSWILTGCGSSHVIVFIWGNHWNHTLKLWKRVMISVDATWNSTAMYGNVAQRLSRGLQWKSNPLPHPLPLHQTQHHDFMGIYYQPQLLVGQYRIKLKCMNLFKKIFKAIFIFFSFMQHHLRVVFMLSSFKIFFLLGENP